MFGKVLEYLVKMASLQRLGLTICIAGPSSLLAAAESVLVFPNRTYEMREQRDFALEETSSSTVTAVCLGMQTYTAALRVEDDNHRDSLTTGTNEIVVISLNGVFSRQLTIRIYNTTGSAELTVASDDPISNEDVSAELSSVINTIYRLSSSTTAAVAYWNKLHRPKTTDEFILNYLHAEKEPLPGTSNTSVTAELGKPQSIVPYLGTYVVSYNAPKNRKLVIMLNQYGTVTNAYFEPNYAWWDPRGAF